MTDWEIRSAEYWESGDNHINYTQVPQTPDAIKKKI